MNAKRTSSESRAHDFHIGQLLEATMDGFVLIDAELRILDVNTTWCVISGYTREELLTLSIRDIEAQHTDDEMRNTALQVIEHGTGRFDTKHRTKDGRILDVEVTATALELDNRPHIACFLRDVTERKRVEEAFHLTQHSIDIVTTGIAWIAPDARLLYVNDFLCRILGYSRDELYTMRITDIDPNLNLEQWSAFFKQVRRQSPMSFQAWGRCKDGKLIPVEVFADFVRAHDKEFVFGFMTDISERRQAEDTIRSKEKELTLLAENVPGYYNYLDADLRFRFINRQFEELMDLPKEQILGKHLAEVLGEETVATFCDEMNKALSGAPSLYEGNLPAHPGRPGHYSLQFVPDLDDKDAVKGIFLMATDLSDRKRAEDVLRESEFKYRTLVEAFPDIVFITDYTGKMLYAGPSLERQTGFTVDDFQFPQEENPFIHPEDASRVASFIQEFAQSTERYSSVIENRFTDKMGRTHWYSSILAKMEYQGEQALQYIVRDITEQTQAREALRLSEEKFSKAFQSSPDPIAITSESDHRFLEVNESFVKISGYSRDEITGKDSIELNFYDNIDDRARLFEALQRGEQIRQWEMCLKNRSGEKLMCDVSMDRITVQDEPALLTVVRDITERKEAELERERAFEEIARLKDELQRERDYLREEVNVALRFGEIVGDSPAIKQVLARIEAVSNTNASVLIMGESGVGKELVARAIHSQSPRRQKSMVRVNCASIPRELFESEFFGHVKGAFTGAHRDRIGRFQLAEGGTIFLDEVAEIPMELQGKLLRVLQEGEYERVGEDKTRSVDGRVIAATNRDLKAEVQARRFREDLYYRLSVFPIDVPPLRERQQDILPLARHFLKRAFQDLDRKPLALTRSHAEALEKYQWPGNIRELHNVIERSVILSRGNRLRLDLAMSTSVRAGLEESTLDDEGRRKTDFLTADELRQLERDNILVALEHADWKVSGPGGAAELLGIKPSTLTYQIKSMGIRKPA
jgi:PAS domain S-box-containing protein